MKRTEVKGKWNKQKGKFKQKVAILTKNGKLFDKGMYDELLGRFQIMLGKTKKNCKRLSQRFNHFFIKSSL